VVFCCDQFAVANVIAALLAASTAAKPRSCYRFSKLDFEAYVRNALLTGFNHFRGIPMAWLFLIVAGLCEIAWAIGLKYTEGFTRLLPTIGTVLAMAASIGFLGLALKSLPVGTAYAVWTGIGTVGTTVLGIYLFNEPAMSLRLACIGFILLGITGLRLTS
jgi:quaternary ammonium compound-resistance protein SugE